MAKSQGIYNTNFVSQPLLFTLNKKGYHKLRNMNGVVFFFHLVIVLIWGEYYHVIQIILTFLLVVNMLWFNKD